MAVQAGHLNKQRIKDELGGGAGSGRACTRVAMPTQAAHSLEVLLQACHGGLPIVGVDLQRSIHAYRKALQSVGSGCPVQGRLRRKGEKCAAHSWPLGGLVQHQAELCKGLLTRTPTAQECFAKRTLGTWP